MQAWAKRKSDGSFRVTEGTRTPDIQDHNLALYHLSYGHHGIRSADHLDRSIRPPPLR